MDDSLHRLILAELSRYRSLTTVQIGNGQLTSFWHDRWILGTTLAQAFPALFSHYTHTTNSVSAVIAGNLSHHLRPQLTRTAGEELTILRSCIQFSPLNEQADLRLLDGSPNSPFNTKGVCRLLHANDEKDPDAAQIWNTKLPGKVKFFGWLLYHRHFNTRANLYHKHICQRDEASCEFCQGILETDEHIFIHCSRVHEVWSRLGINLTPGAHKTPWLIGCHLPLPDQTRTDVTLVLLCHLSKARNAKIFEQLVLPPQEVIRRATQDLDIWCF